MGGTAHCSSIVSGLKFGAARTPSLEFFGHVEASFQSDRVVMINKHSTSVSQAIDFNYENSY